MNSKRKLKEIGRWARENPHAVIETPDPRRGKDLELTGSTMKIRTVPLQLSRPGAVIGGSQETVQENLEEDPVKKKTQASEQLRKFLENLSTIEDLIISHEVQSGTDTACACGRCDEDGTAFKATTRCADCAFSPLTCSVCFTEEHALRYTHWAQVWDDDMGCFVRKDISCVQKGGYSIQLGHNGKPCPSPKSSDCYFTIVDTNGIHNTKICFCECAPLKDRATQLLEARLFPATMTQPTTSFTFKLLKLYNILHVEGKIAMYDFIGSIRRLTDNAFAHNTTDPYPQFRLVSRVWALLTSKRRQGHYHDIDRVFVSLGRQKGSLIVPCPACPDPGFNMEQKWELTPMHLRHLNAPQHTIDGNYHLNKYTKNTDPDDVSLFNGRAYFPSEEALQEYLSGLPVNGKEKVVCEHLKAQEKQNRKKFKNMDVTGVVQVQCRHVLVKSTVDLQLGERFVNADYALATWMRQSKVDVLKSVYKMFSYDIACGFEVNVIPRFQRSFPDLVDLVSNDVKWLIPLMHVQNHKSNCMYLYASSYIDGAGHFHGETSEMVWAESNQLGAQTRQMNGGHRQDTIINATSDWNWKKIANMANLLMEDIREAKSLFEDKRDIHKTLSALYASHIETWNAMDRGARATTAGEVSCVYRQRSEKMITQSRVYELMLQEDARERATDYDGWDSTDRDKESKSAAAGLLSTALKVLSMQRRIKLCVVQRGNSTKRQVTDEELAKEREKLLNSQEKLRTAQKNITPQVEKYVRAQFASNKLKGPEHDVLYLPSDFNQSQRLALGLMGLADDERRLTEGAANDAIQRVQKLSKVRSNACNEKATEGSGQAHNTRSSAALTEIKFKLDLAISDYNDLRANLIKLGLPDNDPVYRPLNFRDTFRKSTVANRSLGDTNRRDGSLWAGNAVKEGPPTGSQIVLESKIATQGTKIKKRKSPTEDTPVNKRQKTATPTKVTAQEDGWIWGFTGRARMSDEELQVWLDEGDRVQWFRSEAEMDRWLEEWEIRQADYVRCIRNFETMSRVWRQLIVRPVRPLDTVQLGKNAYASKKSAMYADMQRYATKLLTDQGYSHLLDNDKAFHEHIQDTRQLAENSLPYTKA